MEDLGYIDDSQASKKAKKAAKDKATPRTTKKNRDGEFKSGRWTKDEHYRFLAALKLYGKEWKRV